MGTKYVAVRTEAEGVSDKACVMNVKPVNDKQRHGTGGESGRSRCRTRRLSEDAEQAALDHVEVVAVVALAHHFGAVGHLALPHARHELVEVDALKRAEEDVLLQGRATREAQNLNQPEAQNTISTVLCGLLPRS